MWNSFGKDMKSCSLKKIKAFVKDDILSKYFFLIFALAMRLEDCLFCSKLRHFVFTTKYIYIYISLTNIYI